MRQLMKLFFAVTALAPVVAQAHESAAHVAGIPHMLQHLMNEGVLPALAVVVLIGLAVWAIKRR